MNLIIILKTRPISAGKSQACIFKITGELYGHSTFN